MFVTPALRQPLSSIFDASLITGPVYHTPFWLTFSRGTGFILCFFSWGGTIYVVTYPA
jgi:hypothetical protein